MAMCTSAIIVSAQSSTGLIIQGDGISYLGWRDPTRGLDNFLGIPFAQPPLGSLRFRPPQPWRPTDGTNLVNATLYSPSCEQDSSNFPNTSEDCLTLDIYKPTNTNGKLPVMVWIYGGGWTTGGTTALYSGFNLVPTSVRLGKPIIYVAINYRVGTYGFPPGQAAADAGILNLGLKDQRLALEWVQNNIGYFGGDPTKVTIFGNSAGSISCGFQSLYNGGDIGGAFRSMILESGSPANAQIRRPNAPPLETAYQVLLNLTQCTNATDSYECLRNAPAELLKQANQEAVKPPPSSQSADSLASIGPVVYEGDASLPEQPSELLKAGKFAKIPFINGAQLDEGTIFVNESYPETEQDILDLLTDPAASFGLTNITAARQLISYYPADPSAGSPYGTGNETFGFAAQFKRLASIVGDFIFQANRRVHLQTAIHHGVPSWSYLFTEVSIWDPVEIPYGVRHTDELNYVFQWIYSNPNASAGLKALGEIVPHYWITFAYQLDPNPTSGERPYWPQYGKNATLLGFSSNISLIADIFRREGMRFVGSPYLWG